MYGCIRCFRFGVYLYHLPENKIIINFELRILIFIRFFFLSVCWFYLISRKQKKKTRKRCVLSLIELRISEKICIGRI